MTQVQRKRMRRRRRFVRNCKRTVVNILLMPARMPKVSVTMIEQAMHASEIAGMVFIAVLLAHLFNPVIFKTAFVILTALIFVTFLLIVKLGDYQDQLEEMKYYGFNI